jgi:hypothetical protein
MLLFFPYRYQIFSIHYMSVRYYFCHIILNAILILLTSVFKILEFHHPNEINNKWKPDYYCILYMIYNMVM